MPHTIISDRGILQVEGRDTQYILVSTETSLVQVFEGHQLRDLFNLAKPGMHCRITSIGMKPTKAKRRVRLFDAQLWTEGDYDPNTQEDEHEAPTARQRQAPKRGSARRSRH